MRYQKGRNPVDRAHVVRHAPAPQGWNNDLQGFGFFAARGAQKGPHMAHNRLARFWHRPPGVAHANARQHIAAALEDTRLAQSLLQIAFPPDEAVPPEVDAISERLEAIADELRYADELLEGEPC